MVTVLPKFYNNTTKKAINGDSSSQVVIVHTFNTYTQKTEEGESLCFGGQLGLQSSRTGSKAAEKLCLENQKNVLRPYVSLYNVKQTRDNYHNGSRRKYHLCFYICTYIREAIGIFITNSSICLYLDIFMEIIN